MGCGVNAPIPLPRRTERSAECLMMADGWFNLGHAVYLLGLLVEDAGASGRRPSDLENQQSWEHGEIS